MKKYNIGDVDKIEGYENVSADFSIPPASASEIRANNVLCQTRPEKVIPMIQMWKKALVLDGRLLIGMVDLLAIADAISNHTIMIEESIPYLYGPGQCNGFTSLQLCEILRHHGFRIVRKNFVGINMVIEAESI